jgi:MOSC domain-containing protein YiiM
MPAGRIVQINVSSGGVPKLALPHAEITTAGVAGDKQRDLKHHGGPDRAVCLYALERVEALQAEGHPVEPGALGENLTLAGLDWDAVAPGVTLRLGADVIVEVASYTAPCGTIRACFTDENPQRISQDRHPGWSRVYGRILAEGRVEVGDEVFVDY